jgi:hypothetical protein
MDNLKVLGQILPSAGVLSVAYTVPAATNTVISSIVACNTDTNNTTFRISVAINGAADATKQYIYFDLPIEGNDTFIATVGLSLNAGDVIRVQSASGLVAFNVFGDEVS